MEIRLYESWITGIDSDLLTFVQWSHWRLRPVSLVAGQWQFAWSHVGLCPGVTGCIVRHCSSRLTNVPRRFDGLCGATLALFYAMHPLFQMLLVPHTCEKLLLNFVSRLLCRANRVTEFACGSCCVTGNVTYIPYVTSSLQFTCECILEIVNQLCMQLGRRKYDAFQHQIPRVKWSYRNTNLLSRYIVTYNKRK